jgi:phosphoglycolate phosphatase-like HAD superfamily hydrolase
VDGERPRRAGRVVDGAREPAEHERGDEPAERPAHDLPVPRDRGVPRARPGVVQCDVGVEAQEVGEYDHVLLLFDIDGTLLITAAGAHADALRAAVERVWDVPDASAVRVQTAGRTDPEIARVLLGELGVPAHRIDAGMPAFIEACAAEYERRVPADLTDRVAPGVPELLEELVARDDVTLSLVTGNLEPVARAKLGAAGIGHFFARGQGGFARTTSSAPSSPRSPAAAPAAPTARTRASAPSSSATRRAT